MKRTSSHLIAGLLFLGVFNALTPTGAAAASPGGRIAFVALVGDTWQVCTLNPDGTGFRQLTDSPGDKTHPSWSSGEGRILAATGAGRLVTVDPNADGESFLDIGVHGVTDAVWSADGRRVLFSQSIANSIDANDIWLVEIAGAARRRLTRMRHMQHDPAWSHDERQVVFVSGAGGQHHDLFVLDPASGAVRQLTAGQRYHFEPACSVNGEIAVSANRGGDYEIWVCDFFGNHFERITHSPGLDAQPAWSPDGRRLAFVSVRGGYTALWVMDRNGGGAHRISPEGMLCRGPAWER